MELQLRVSTAARRCTDGRSKVKQRSRVVEVTESSGLVVVLTRYEGEQQAERIKNVRESYVQQYKSQLSCWW